MSQWATDKLQELLEAEAPTLGQGLTGMVRAFKLPDIDLDLAASPESASGKRLSGSPAAETPTSFCIS